jgi:predicted nucleic acid-binding protein
VALTHLLDTSVVSRLGAPMVKAVVEPLVNEGRLGRAGITDLEVGYGSRNARESDQDLVDLPVFELVETTAEHIRRARQV